MIEEEYGEADPELVETLIEQLELELEWGVRVTTRFGDLFVPYQNEGIARFHLKQYLVDESESKPVLVHRYVGQWTDVND